MGLRQSVTEVDLAYWKKKLEEKKLKFKLDDIIWYLDEASINWIMAIYRMWAKNGHQPVLPGQSTVRACAWRDPWNPRQCVYSSNSSSD